ncbi:MAG: hypothetical protein RLZ86_78 [Actinomycetota bacterium]
MWNTVPVTETNRVEPPTNRSVLSHFTLAPMHPFEDRVRLAGENGFSSIGFFVGHFLRMEKEGWSIGRMGEVLERHGVTLSEIEVVPGLGRDGSGGERSVEWEDAAWRLADAFGCRYLQVIGPAGERSEAARAFGSLCDRAADHGLVVGLEFVPFTDIVSCGDARRIVEDAGRSNGGVCVDVWHVERGARDLDELAELPGELITGVQVNDGSREPVDPDYYTDCLANRVAPGDGEMRVAEILAIVRRSGSTVPWSVEAPSSAGWMSPDEHVARCARGLSRFMNEGGTE